ncbi:TlpA disulfide reductase family protein [Maribellus sp. YY47]|uniref:TlpA disulfide reductase family protein n=1 Tax=Maribellus sp. YY47 TaxID=2929486 RepID=UPI002000AF55|nr:TlpA disulfide reductase family protein [Maribellus sp. YY47]MCK3683254.1 AhpC/TSA family protein [Maribellus sp. YY47]
MKKYFVLIIGIALFACSKPSGFKIDVNLEGADGQIVLEERTEGKFVGIDTADVVDGVAVLEGSVEYPTMYYISILGQRAKAMIFVENAKMTVTGKADSINFVKIEGSATQDEYSALNDQMKAIQDEYMNLYKESVEARQAGDTAKASELMAKVEEIYESASERMNTLQEDFVKNNPASYVSPVILNSVQYNKSAEQLDSMINALDPKVQQVPMIVDMKAQIEKMKRVSIGQIAPDFTQNDPDGNPVKFSDIYSQNELTLLDFWASWCGPCRQENPNVVAVYNEFKDKGFTVFGVSLDRDKDAWLKGIADDGLTWAHVSDLAYWGNAAAQEYAIRSIPSSLLVDKTGKIVEKNKRGEELKAFVEGYFAK